MNESGEIITTSLRPNPGIMLNKGNHPKIAEHFRLVNYYNLPRNNVMGIYGDIRGYKYFNLFKPTLQPTIKRPSMGQLF